MKKLMFGLATIACAVSLNAATFIWSSGGDGNGFLVGTDGSTKISRSMAAGYNMFSVQLWNETQDCAMDVAKTSAAINMNVAGAFSNTATYNFGTSETMPAGVGTTGDKVVLKLVMQMTKDGTIYDMTVDQGWTITATDGTGKDTAAYTSATLGGLGSTGDKNVWVARSSPGPDPIPEPTSAMLMLLGMAGLALRRKQI